MTALLILWEGGIQERETYRRYQERTGSWFLSYPISRQTGLAFNNSERKEIRIIDWYEEYMKSKIKNPERL